MTSSCFDKACDLLARRPHFRAELERWRGRFDITVEAIVDHSGADWYGPVGVVTRLVAEADVDPEFCLAMICGPEIMMRFAAQALVEAGVPDNAIHLSMERHMKCGLGHCGRCQYGPYLICRDGPVMTYQQLRRLLTMREL